MNTEKILNSSFLSKHRRLNSIFEVFAQTYREWQLDGTHRLGAGIAYYGVISLIPIIIIAYNIANVFFSKTEILEVMNTFIIGLFGEKAESIDLSSITSTELVEQSSFLGWAIGVGSLLFAATILFIAINDALNVIWKTRTGFSFSITRYVFSFLIMLLTGAMLTVTLSVYSIISIAEDVLPLEDTFLSYFSGMFGSAVVLILASSVVLILEKTFIKVEIRLKDLVISSIIIALLAYVGFYIIAIYMANFADKSVYGSLSGVVLVLIAIYYFAQIFLAGSQLSKVISYRNGNPHLKKVLKKTDPRLQKST